MPEPEEIDSQCSKNLWLYIKLRIHIHHRCLGLDYRSCWQIYRKCWKSFIMVTAMLYYFYEHPVKSKTLLRGIVPSSLRSPFSTHTMMRKGQEPRKQPQQPQHENERKEMGDEGDGFFEVKVGIVVL